MRRGLVLLTLASVAGLVAAMTAWAGAPDILRFQEPELVYGSDAGAFSTLRQSTETTASPFSDPRVFIDGIVVVGIKEGVVTHLTAPFEAVYVCVNGGGNVPSAENKTTLVGELEASATFPAAKNGRATGSLLTGPLPTAADAAAATGFACPAGQVLEFDRVIFSGLVLSVDGGEVENLSAILVSESVHGVS